MFANTRGGGREAQRQWWVWRRLVEASVLRRIALRIQYALPVIEKIRVEVRPRVCVPLRVGVRPYIGRESSMLRVTGQQGDKVPGTSLRAHH